LHLQPDRVRNIQQDCAELFANGISATGRLTSDRTK
jgi:hypothetical protein